MSRSSRSATRRSLAGSSPAASIDRAPPLAFSFDGRADGAIAGDTLASALLANGVRLVGRSFKYHRPRGIFTAGSGGAERAGRAAHRRAARAEHAGDHGRALRRARGAQPEPLAVARLDLLAVNQLVSPLPRRRLLLQDLHVAGLASGRSSTSR